MNRLREMSEAFADAVRREIAASDALASSCRVTVLVEDRLGASFAIEDSLGRNGVCVIVGVTGFDRKADAGRLVHGTVRFDVGIYENPAMCRETEDAPTAQTVAEFVMRRMHWYRPDGWRSPLLFGSMTRADEYPCVVERLTFTAETELT